jgi:CheY-like chemotaxis protein
MESEGQEKSSAEQAPESLSKATNELNNLLQIITGTSSLIEEGNDGSDKCVAILRASVERAEKVTAGLAQHAGGSETKNLVHPDIAGPSKTKSPPADDAPRQTILVVDDDQMAITLVKRVLSDAGFHVITAQSGFECLELFRRRPHSCDLVLLDLAMPLMDGEETFQRLREIRADVPVVLCAGFIQQDCLERMMHVGLSGFLRKPLPPEEIIAHVRSVLDGVKFMGPTASAGFSSAV